MDRVVRAETGAAALCSQRSFTSSDQINKSFSFSSLILGEGNEANLFTSLMGLF